MGLLDRLKSRLPEVPVGPETNERVHERVRAMAAGPYPDQALIELRGFVEEDLLGLSPAFVRELGKAPDELAVELYLQAGLGFILGAEEESDRDRAVALQAELHSALREYVAFAWRADYDQGSLALLQAAERLSIAGQDPKHIAMGMTAVRLGVAFRRGAVEGLLRLGLLAQLAGYGAGKLAVKRRGRSDDAEE